MRLQVQLGVVGSGPEMNISTAASIVVSKPLEEAFDFCCRNETHEKHLQPGLPVAGVQKCEFFDGHSLKEGDHRRVTLTDGSVLDEQILDYAPPSLHRYRWFTGLRGPFALLVRSGTGTWTFTEVGGGTQIDWSYDFALKSALAYPLALPVMPLFRGWLKQSLQSIQGELSG